MQTTLQVTTALLLAQAACTAAETATLAQAPTQTTGVFEFQHARKATVNYLLYLPKGCEPGAEKKWPLILFLHGAGERGSSVWKVAATGLPARLKNETNFPFVVVSPQCPDGLIWSDSELLLGLLEQIESKYPVDRSRVYLTGLSMGGYGTWELGLNHPDKFAAIAPICGGGQTISALLASGPRAQALKTLGVWAFHGGKDIVVPVAESERMMAVLRRAGVSDAKLTVYPEAGHDSWTETYRNPELFDWFLKHQRIR